MKQIFCLGGPATNTTTAGSGANSQCAISGSGRTTTWDFDDDGSRHNVIAAPGTLRRLTYNVDSAAGSGHYRGLRFDIDGSNTSDVRCNDPSVVASEPYSESVTAGQLVRVEATEDSDSATPSDSRWGVAWEGDNASEAIIGSCVCVPLGTLIPAVADTVRYFSTVGSGSSTTTESQQYFYAPLACTLKSFYIDSSRDLYNGTWSGSVTFSIYVNGTEDTSAQVVFQDGDTSGNVTGLSIDIAAGDTITISATPTGTLGSTVGGTITFGIMYTPDTDGESMIGGGSLDDLDSTTRYLGMNFVMESSAFNPPAFTTELDAQGISPGSFTLKDLRVNVITAPGTGESRTFTIRKNGSDTSLTCTVSGTGTSCTDTSNTATFSAEDLFSLKLVDDNGSAATTDFHWSAVMYDVDFPTFRPHLIMF